MEKEKKQNKISEERKKKTTKVAEQTEKFCKDNNCPFHGRLKIRGRIFEGKITKKLHRRIVIEFERMIYIAKYERYAKSKTKLHARIPSCMENEINIGDIVLIQECRPLSKIVHFVVIKKIKSEQETK